MSADTKANLISHHASYLIGGLELRDKVLSALEREHQIRAQGNPDFFDRAYETFTVEHARELRAAHDTRPITAEGKKIFIVAMAGITVEAQNSLLKLFEEPAPYAHFFLIIPARHLLLPTVISRMRAIDMEREGAQRKQHAAGTSAQAPQTTQTTQTTQAAKFLSLSKPARLEMVKELLDEISDEKRPKQDAIELLYALESAIHENEGPIAGRPKLEIVQQALKYATDRAPSLKMLLEHVALHV